MRPTHFSGWAIELGEAHDNALVTRSQMAAHLQRYSTAPIIPTALFLTKAHADLVIRLERKAIIGEGDFWNDAEPVKVRITLEAEDE